jgi:hypothetical protein
LLAVAFPDGARFDLGILEFLAMIPIAALAFGLGRLWGRARAGRLAAVVGGTFAFLRLALLLTASR